LARPPRADVERTHGTARAIENCKRDLIWLWRGRQWEARRSAAEGAQAMNATALIGGAALGAGLMFLLDPSAGGRRQALTRDKLTKLGRKSREAADATMTDVQNRASGMVAETRGLFARERPDNVKLVERVRARLGRVVSHPGAIEVTSEDGRVTLRGPILSSEVTHLLWAVNRVRGVNEVNAELEAHGSPEGVPALQGSSTRPDQPSAWLKSGWSPTGRLVAGLAGTAAAALMVGSRFKAGGGDDVTR
jgi:hypothetical protein